MSVKTYRMIKKLLHTLYELLCNNRQAELSVKINGIIIKGKSMTIIARNDQKVNFSPVFKDAYGNDVTELGSVPKWTVSDQLLATVSSSEDGLTAVVTSTGVDGSVEVNMVVDADPSAGVEEIVGKATVTFKPGKAVFVTLSGTVAEPTTATPTPTPTETPVPAPTETPAPTDTPTPTSAPTEAPSATEAPAETPTPTEAPATVTSSSNG